MRLSRQERSRQGREGGDAGRGNGPCTGHGAAEGRRLWGHCKEAAGAGAQHSDSRGREMGLEGEAVERDSA